MFTYGEVQFYFELTMSSGVTRTLALVSQYSPPHRDMLVWSSGTVWSCHALGRNGLTVIDAIYILECVAMVPHAALTSIPGYTSTPYFVVEKLGDVDHSDSISIDMDGN